MYKLLRQGMYVLAMGFVAFLMPMSTVTASETVTGCVCGYGTYGQCDPATIHEVCGPMGGICSEEPDPRCLDGGVLFCCAA